jgi:hypothetical protein
MLAKYIKETCNMADFSDNEILTALGMYHKEMSSILADQWRPSYMSQIAGGGWELRGLSQ